MPASNIDVAKVFDDIADLLEIQDENAFRVRAYRNAARVVEGLGASVAEMLRKGEDLTELPGIGKDLAGKIREIVETGTCAAHEDLRKKLPPTITTLLKKSRARSEARAKPRAASSTHRLYRSTNSMSSSPASTAPSTCRARNKPGASCARWNIRA